MTNRIKLIVVLTSLAGIHCEDTSLLQVSLQTDSTDEVERNYETTLRGNTWCELNPSLGEGRGIAVIFPQIGMGPAFEATGQNMNQQSMRMDQCPYQSWNAIVSPRDDTSAAAKYVRANFKITGQMEYNGHKKSLWDTSETKCMQGGGPPTPSDLICACGAQGHPDCHCMWFRWGTNNTLEGFSSYVVASTMGYPTREYRKGKVQPVLTDPDGNTWVLQSYFTTQNRGTSTEPMVSGGTTEPGEDENICEYIEKCCPEKPDGWTISCGVLAETVICGTMGKECVLKPNDVMIDDELGTWCKTLPETQAVVVPQAQ